METRFLKEKIKYTGKELKSHFAYREFDIAGDSLLAFCGACDVRTDSLVDLADVKADAGIFSKEMLHFIGEFFEMDLEKTILKQRLLMTIIKEELESRSVIGLKRLGDDIYDGEAKLTVSIATMTPVSTMIHAGININSEGTPLLTKGLDDYGIDTSQFGDAVLKKFAAEMDGVRTARCKVRGVE